MIRWSESVSGLASIIIDPLLHLDDVKPPLIEPADPHGVPVATHFTQLGGAWNNDIALGSSENPFFYLNLSIHFWVSYLLS